MLLSNPNQSQSRQVELKARCNVSSVKLLDKIWYYKHYDANFYKDAEEQKSFIGFQLAQNYRTKTEHNESFLIECNYVKNQSIETWIADFGDISEMTKHLIDAENNNAGNAGNAQFIHKLAKQDVYITSISEGKWIRSNPRIWETNQTYYEIDENTQEIKTIIPPKDPVITGKITSRSVKRKTQKTQKTPKNSKDDGGDSNPKEKTDTQNNGFLDQHITAVMSTRHAAHNHKKYLPKEDTYQFSQIVEDGNSTIPYIVIRGNGSIELLKSIKTLFADQFNKTFKKNVESKHFKCVKIPETSSLLKHPSETGYILYYVDPNREIRFNTLKDQRLWWKSIQHLIYSKPEYMNFKYFVRKGNIYTQRSYIDFDVYNSHTSIPLFIGSQGLILCPGTCYSRYEETVAKPQEYEFNVPVLNTNQISFTQTQLENVVKVSFPNVSSESFHKISNNCLKLDRNNCIMEIIQDQPFKCKEKSGTLVFNTVFRRTPQTQNAICQVRYKCECSKDNNSGLPIAYIFKSRRSTENQQDTSFEPVTLDEHVEFPENMHFEDTVKNTDVGSAEVFVNLYKGRYIYNPQDESFYYFKGDVWEKDSRPYNFTDTIVATKLSSCMDKHIDELNNELARELERQVQNKGVISKLNHRIKKCIDQRERLTKGKSKVKTFIKTRLTDKKFNSKLEHKGKIAASNGLVDLKTGKINMFTPKDYISEKCKFAYYKCTCKPGTCFNMDDDGNILCNSIIANKMQKLIDIIKEIMGCDAQDKNGKLIYDHRLFWHFIWCIGYALSGEGNRKYLMYCHSPANSGKSLLLEAVIEILGEYFGVIPKGALFGKKGANGPSPELIMIKGKRGGFCDEVGKDDKIDDRNAKAITGRSRIELRGMCQEYESHKFKTVPFIAANQYVEISSLDPALWDRFMPLLFPIHFARSGIDKNNKIGTERLRDESIVDMFEEEDMKTAYFNIVNRSSTYYYSNLDKKIPKEIQDKLNELKKESFALDEFIDQSEKYEFNKDESVPIKPLYEEFKKFAQDNNIRSKMGYSLAQFRNMIRQMTSDVGYDRTIELDEKQGRGAKTKIRGIKLNNIELDTEYREYPHNTYQPSPLNPSSPKKRIRDEDANTPSTSLFYDPNTDQSKKTKLS